MLILLPNNSFVLEINWKVIAVSTSLGNIIAIRKKILMSMNINSWNILRKFLCIARFYVNLLVNFLGIPNAFFMMYVMNKHCFIYRGKHWYFVSSQYLVKFINWKWKKGKLTWKVFLTWEYIRDIYQYLNLTHLKNQTFLLYNIILKSISSSMTMLCTPLFQSAQR